MSRRLVRPSIVNRDLEEISDYIAADNPRAAERFLRAVEATFEKLADMPGLGAEWDEFETPILNLRFWPLPRYRNYVIFYRPLSDGVEIVRVVHGSRIFKYLFR